jgi:2-C-methyl-D-erythritol 4-phosphate cytidylyltransferase/2-C-methyl-D-erythritol 2,4-cyclodiphosphate synthase
MGGKIKKEYLHLNDGTVLSTAVRSFLETLKFDILVIAIPVGGEKEARNALFRDKNMPALIGSTKLLFVAGGTTRQQSVLHALEAVNSSGIFSSAPDALILIHDGARPFVTPVIIKAVVQSALTGHAAVPVLTPVDTHKEIDDNGIITRHLDRTHLVAVQTPQGFRFTELLNAHRKAAGDGCAYTDDAEIWGKYAGSVRTVPGDTCNRKITYPEDVPVSGQGGTMIRTGIGYDLHPLVSGRKLLLGGIQIPFGKGENGHSDGDVLFHAITDALLGASGLGDIGSFFPPADEKWKDANSASLLRTVWEKITGAGWTLGNIDCVVALEQPQFLPWRDRVRTSIADTLNVSADRVFVKAKTGEKMGIIGQGEAIAVWAVCLLEKEQRSA